MSKASLSEIVICDQFITPALVEAGWDQATQIRREYPLSDGRIEPRGNQGTRGKRRRADYALFYERTCPLAIIEAKNNTHAVGDGMQQALAYAQTLDVPFVFSSNGDGFLFHDRTGLSDPLERFLPNTEFPSPDELWRRYHQWRDLPDQADALARIPYHDDGSGKEPRYYQRVAIERTIEAVAHGQRHILLVMATGTGKTYTTFQIIWRLCSPSSGASWAGSMRC